VFNCHKNRGFYKINSIFKPFKRKLHLLNKPNVKKQLNKTIDLAVIIKKLKKIRDEELNNNKEKSLKKKNKEIIKLNETIDLAEDLFKKELLDL